MENRIIRIGDLHQITTQSFSGDAVVTEVHGIQTSDQKGVLVNYCIQDYGETNAFYLPDGQILEAQADGRRSRSGMPKEYVYKTAKNFDWTQYGEDVTMQKRIANAFVKRFEAFRKQGRGLYIYSDTKGSGKTMLACCIVNEVLKEVDIPVKFISMPEYIELVKDKSEGAKAKIKSVLEAVLLIVDDIGATTEDKEWISNAIFRLVNWRHENLLPTIYTSNVPIEKLKCDDRIVSRIYEDSVPVIMPEVSIRRKKADKYRSEFLRQILEEKEPAASGQAFPDSDK